MMIDMINKTVSKNYELTEYRYFDIFIDTCSNSLLNNQGTVVGYR